MNKKTIEATAGQSRSSGESAAHLAGVALGGLAGGAVGAVVGSKMGRGNGSTVLGAAVGAAAGVLMIETATAATLEAEMTCVVIYLQQHLGPTTTAYISGADDLAVVNRWAAGSELPDLASQRLCVAREATRYLVDAYGDTAAQSWFLGTNDVLDCESPAFVLRHGRQPADWEFVIPAARQFVENAR